MMSCDVFDFGSVAWNSELITWNCSSQRTAVLKGPVVGPITFLRIRQSISLCFSVLRAEFSYVVILEHITMSPIIDCTSELLASKP